MTANKERYALISVSDKAGLVDFAYEVRSFGFKFLATTGGAELLRQSHIPVDKVDDITGFPEILDGRVKTLHPMIHGGILAKRDNDAHLATLAEHNIPQIDMVIVNLYPFTDMVAHHADADTIIENIDIGGVCLLRAAAKNFKHVVTICDRNDYPLIITELKQNDGKISEKTRLALAQKAFSVTSWYDAAINNYLFNKIQTEAEAEVENPQSDKPANKVIFSEYNSISGKKKADLRYGENHHQAAAVYEYDSDKSGIAHAQLLHGIQMGYNNYLDADCALSIISGFDNPACAIVKHANPCGVAEAFANDQVWRRALNCDPQSAFGGIAAFNRTIDKDLATQISEIFLEVLIAPHFTEEALKILKQRSKLRILACKPVISTAKRLEVKSITGGYLVQSEDLEELNPANLTTLSKREPSEQELTDLIFGWHVVKYVKSNAIVIARDRASVGIGAGQMSRIDSASLALLKAKKFQGAAESVAASDAFFPFPDTVELLANAGITAIIQSAGSMRDQEVIDAANRYNIAMVATHIRHFRH